MTMVDMIQMDTNSDDTQKKTQLLLYFSKIHVCEEVLKIRFRPAVLCVRCPLWVCYGRWLIFFIHNKIRVLRRLRWSINIAY